MVSGDHAFHCVQLAGSNRVVILSGEITSPKEQWVGLPEVLDGGKVMKTYHDN